MNIILVGITISLLLALPAAASDYTLEIFGNANEDDTINMQDVTQIELVILGKENELTIVDAADRIVTLGIPIESIAVMYPAIAEAAIAIGATDKIVAIDRITKDRPHFYPQLK